MAYNPRTKDYSSCHAEVTLIDEIDMIECFSMHITSCHGPHI